MPVRIRELKDVDLVEGSPLVCPSCNCYMTLKEKLKNGKGKDGTYRRRRFNCTSCGYSEIIYADGARDVTPYVISDRETKEKIKEDNESRKRVK